MTHEHNSPFLPPPQKITKIFSPGGSVSVEIWGRALSCIHFIISLSLSLGERKGNFFLRASTIERGWMISFPRDSRSGPGKNSFTRTFSVKRQRPPPSSSSSLHKALLSAAKPFCVRSSSSSDFQRQERKKAKCSSSFPEETLWAKCNAAKIGVRFRRAVRKRETEKGEGRRMVTMRRLSRNTHVCVLHINTHRHAHLTLPER